MNYNDIKEIYETYWVTKCTVPPRVNISQLLEYVKSKKSADNLKTISAMVLVAAVNNLR